MSSGNAALAYINSVYFSFKADKNKRLWLLFLDLLLEQSRVSYSADYNTCKKEAIIYTWIIELAGASYSFFGRKTTLACLWSWLLFTICSLIVKWHLEWVDEVADECKYI